MDTAPPREEETVYPEQRTKRIMAVRVKQVAICFMVITFDSFYSLAFHPGEREGHIIIRHVPIRRPMHEGPSSLQRYGPQGPDADITLPEVVPQGIAALVSSKEFKIFSIALFFQILLGDEP